LGNILPKAQDCNLITPLKATKIKVSYLLFVSFAIGEAFQKPKPTDMKPFALTFLFYALISFGITATANAQCDIGEIEATPTECDSAGYFDMIINFEYANTGSQGFTIQGSGLMYGTFQYDDLPVITYGLIGDGTTYYEFVVIDVEFPICSNFIDFGTVDCFGGDCEIGELIIDEHPCDSNGMFNVYFDFDYANVSDSGFVLEINNDIYGYYFYEDLPLTNLGPFDGDGTTIYHFLVRDVDTYECASDANFGPIDCGTTGNCEIGELDVTILPCDDNDEFFVLLDFDCANTSDGFSVQGGGMMYGNYLYADLPVEVGPFSGNGNAIYQLAVVDNIFSGCLEDTQFGPVSCDSITEFMNFATQVVFCEGASYNLEMDFEVMNGGNDGFTIIGNGEEYGSYEYAQLPVIIGPLITDGSTHYHFIAKDKEQPAYGNWDKLTPFTCASLGIVEPEHEKIVKVYPNPSYGSITFKNLKQESITARVYNSSGAEIKTFSFSGTYKMEDLNAGMYYYRIMDSNGSVSSGKIIVTK